MPSKRLELRPLQESDEVSFKIAVKEYESETPPREFAFGFDPAGDFAAYVRKLDGWAKGLDVTASWVPSTFYVGVVDGMIVGRLSLRHRLNPFLEQIGGHIGYGVIPSQRKHGYATAMLRQALPHCSRLGIDRALVTCGIDNIGSQKVIEKCGGQFESIAHAPEKNEHVRRYWIAIDRSGLSKEPSHH